MVTNPIQGDTDLAAPGDDLASRAVGLAQRWIAESAQVDVDPSAERLAGVLKDPNGLPFTIGFVDGVMRPESLTAAATNLQRVAPLAPGFLPWSLRGAVRAGGAVAPVLPWPTVPIARRVLRRMVGHLVVDARPEKLGPAIAKIRESGAKLNLNLLGEAVLGEQEALRRLDGIHELIRRPDVDYVSVKVSAIASHISMWAFDEVVDKVVERLMPLYLTAATDGTFINLDMEEYRDLDLTIAVFTRILEDPRLRRLEGGIVLQAYLPDALPALKELTAWAQQRVANGGSRIKIRLVKGANLAMERVDAIMHGWSLATYGSKLDSDASYIRCLDFALRAENTAAVRIGVAGHNLFDIAYAWLLAGQRGVRAHIEFEMLLGMAQGQVAAVSREVGHVLLYVPVVRPDEFDVAISYLVRRLEENASSENFLSAAFDLADDPSMFARERDRFLASIRRAADSTLPTGPNRTQDRTAVAEAAPATPGLRSRARRAAEAGLTKAVLGIARAGEPADTAPVEPDRGPMLFGGESFVETAVYSPRESEVPASGAPGFENAADTDPALAANRAWGREILGRVDFSTAGDATIHAARIDDAAALEGVVARVREAAGAWGALPAAERSAVLQAAGRALEARRAELIEVAASETGKVLAEADVEVSEAVDFANYYAATARELDRVSGAVFVPSRLTVVTPPWNFPVAIPAGGVLAALAAGSGVVFKPAPQARRCAAVVAEALWEAGVPRDVLALVDIDEGSLGQRLVSHPDVDRVILTGSWETAALFRSWRPELPLLAETSGKNAMIITPSADLDLAAGDLVKSAFGHAGQKCSAASLAILVGPVGHSRRFARQLFDAATSLRVGPPTDPLSEVGPVIEQPHGKLEWALTTLAEGEKWLIEPTLVDAGPEYTGRMWTPGIRTGVQPGSRFHREEFFGPVLGVMHAQSLSHAIQLQNAVSYGLTAGLYTQDPHELALWLERVEAGNLYVNRGITGAIVQRQPFGGWKRSSVGAGAKAGGPNYLIGLGKWRASAGATVSKTLHLRGLDTRIAEVIEAAQPSLGFEEFEWVRRAALSDALAWDREFGQVKDVSRLGVERNLFRYRPVPGFAVRATADAPWHHTLRVALAGVRAGTPLTVSAPAGFPPAVRRALSEQGVAVYVETDEQWIERVGGVARAAEGDGADAVDLEPRPQRPPRVRLVGSAASVSALHRALAEVTGGDPDMAVYDNEVTTAGRIELLPFLREQSITITAHRFGNPDSWSEAVI
ncbi:bifunctional proline dehydrogenase/L-glutamate gamma-semialdehyde dehydrogenase [Microbacterium immunditiarum]|uniref:L-glutamate gamma-semialdehyde dehydrogenase n=1 Tax=Microbacterium immunditiarum TaxID=337480 RepID=A0A7Y9GLW2_9MICO|nr:bifunctional proline dehydrogenase/L-glutamate gamma-semialdehyde dehydrogenase [Microbacterium immunditiarum]NYE18837.1 RHH-type proline utilization regulon transcriptional repressor/proline dehydrogenase/delta 1-pyrroline-5-carboxylate dehydrogenase [Microbacterium immunditiarum]